MDEKLEYKIRQIIESYLLVADDTLISGWIMSKAAQDLICQINYEWVRFAEHRPENLDIVAVIDERGESEFGVYQERWEWVSCVNGRILKPVYWLPLPPIPNIH